MVRRVGILGRDGTNKHTAQLTEALAGCGVRVVYCPVTAMLGAAGGDVKADGEVLNDLDVLLVRHIPGGSLEQVILRMDMLHRVQRAGVRVINPPAAIEKTVDKFYTSTLLAESGLPTPHTVVTESFALAMRAFQAMGDVVVKPLFGSLGTGMVRVSDPDTAYRVFRALELGRYVFYLQEYIAHPGWDIRVLVIGGEAAATMRRVSDDWRANVHRGAVPEACTVPEAEALAVRAAGILDLDYAGVDLLPAGAGYTITELNSTPGWEGLEGVTGVKVAGRLASYLLEGGGRG